jgi:peptide chain release factor 1
MKLAEQLVRLRERFAQLEEEIAQGDFYSNPARAQEKLKEHARLGELVALGDRWEKCGQELAQMEELLRDTTDPELRELADQEIARLRAEEEELGRRLLLGLLPPDPNEGRNTIVEIRAGTGGEEACLFAADLYRMYSRYAERKGWKKEVLSTSPSELGGFKEIIFLLSGPNVYRKMQYESGVHRVQRVPVTESQGRIHTSTATVAVLPEAQEVDVVLKPEELRIEVCRAGGPGGQGVNTTDSAVQVLHIPTGIIVRCQDERSQLKNREKALRILRARLLQRRQEEERLKLVQARRQQIGSGDRHEKIRTYNFPQNRVTDHRIHLTLYDLAAVLDGDLDPLLDALAQSDAQEKLAELARE